MQFQHLMIQKEDTNLFWLQDMKLNLLLLQSNLLQKLYYFDIYGNISYSGYIAYQWLHITVLRLTLSM